MAPSFKNETSFKLDDIEILIEAITIRAADGYYDNISSLWASNHGRVEKSENDKIDIESL